MTWSVLCTVLTLIGAGKATSSIPSKTSYAFGTAIYTSSCAPLACCSACFTTPVGRKPKAIPANITAKAEVANVAPVNLAFRAFRGTSAAGGAIANCIVNDHATSRKP